MKNIIYSVIILFVFCCNAIAQDSWKHWKHISEVNDEGFLDGTKIVTPLGLISIEHIRVGDTITCLDDGNQLEQTITNISTSQISEYIQITMQSEIIYAGCQQKFYIANENKWVNADTLKEGDCLLTSDPYNCRILTVEKIKENKTSYNITTSTHSFYITHSCIYVHNAAPAAIALIALANANPVIPILEAGIAVGIGFALLISLFTSKKQNNSQNSILQKESGTTNRNNGCQCGCGCLSELLCNQNCGCKKTDINTKANNFFETLKKISDKKVRHRKFGNFYRDPNSKLWWSKDITQHGGSRFKVFKETAKGLEWLFDADAMGNQIVNKHKSPIGAFIPYKEMIIIS